MVGETKQDTYTASELGKIFTEQGLEKGQYQLDVGEDRNIKFSRVKKQWIQKDDIV